MTYDLSAKIASLEMRVRQQEEELRAQRQELIGAARAFHELRELFDALDAEHQNLAQEYRGSWEAFTDILASQRQDLKNLTVIVRNTANSVFPGIEDAFQEIDKALGLKDDKSPG